MSKVYSVLVRIIKEKIMVLYRVVNESENGYRRDTERSVGRWICFNGI